MGAIKACICKSCGCYNKWFSNFVGAIAPTAPMLTHPLLVHSQLKTKKLKRRLLLRKNNSNKKTKNNNKVTCEFLVTSWHHWAAGGAGSQQKIKQDRRMKCPASTFLVYHLFLTLLWFTTLISTTHTSAGKTTTMLLYCMATRARNWCQSKLVKISPLSISMEVGFFGLPIIMATKHVIL